MVWSFFETVEKILRESLFDLLRPKGWKRAPEKESLRIARERQKYVWLYHSTPEKNIEKIKEEGLDPKYIGTTHGATSEHPSKKPCLSYSSHKGYSVIWGGLRDREPLLVKVPTKDLFFGIRDPVFGFDEYLSIHKIPPKHIVFPEDPLYRKIEKKTPYLSSRMKIKEINMEVLDFYLKYLQEVAPPGWEGTVKKMKKHKRISSPWALAWWMYKRGYKPHYTKTGKKKK